MISEEGHKFCTFKHANNLMDVDFECFVDEEHQYLSNLKVPWAGDEMDIEYVLALKAFEAAEWCQDMDFFGNVNKK